MAIDNFLNEGQTGASATTVGTLFVQSFKNPKHTLMKFWLNTNAIIFDLKNVMLLSLKPLLVSSDGNLLYVAGRCI